MRSDRLILPIDDIGWQLEWPTEPNTMWWFYGWTSSFSLGREDCLPRLISVEVWKTGSGCSWVSGSQFLYQGDAYGMWQRVEIKSIPNLTRPSKQ